MKPSPSVLVVDDDPDVRALVSTLLGRAGYLITEAPDGRAALKALYDQRPDLVVLDVNMPDLDGWATLERIRDLSDVPVVMLSARGEELEKVRALRAGADDYVTKPFGRQELLARVESVLRRAVGAGPKETYSDALLTVDFAERRAHRGRALGRADAARVQAARRPSSSTRTSCSSTVSCSSWSGAASAEPHATRSSSTSATCARSSRTPARSPARSRPCAASATATRPRTITGPARGRPRGPAIPAG